MSLLFAHHTLCGISFEDDFEASDGFGVHFIIDDNLGLIIGIDIPFRDAERIIEINRQLFKSSGVIILRYLSLLVEFYLINFNVVMISQHFFELIQGHVKRHIVLFLFGVLTYINDIIDDDNGYHL